MKSAPPARRAMAILVGLLALGVGAWVGLRIVRHFEAKPKPAVVNDLYSVSNRIFKRGRRDRNAVCLTIDDGPHPKSLPRILEILRRYHAKATFFMVGKRIAESPEEVRQVLRDGHEVGNHTENHVRLDTLSPDQVRTELALCESNFEQATGGAKMALFRPPGMRFTPEVLKIAREFDYTTVDWNYGGKDFTKFVAGPTSAGQNHIAEFVLEQVTPGGIILLHDNPDTADALPAILEGLRQKGLEVVNVTQMLSQLPQPVYVKSNAGHFGKLAMKG